MWVALATGAPVTEVPGDRPSSRSIVVAPVLVTVEEASTEKLTSVPSVTGASAAWATPANARLMATIDAMPTVAVLGLTAARAPASGRVTSRFVRPR